MWGVFLSFLGVVLIAFMIGVVWLLLGIERRNREQSANQVDIRNGVEKKLELTEARMSREVRHISHTFVEQMSFLQKSFDSRLQDNTNRLDTRLNSAADQFSRVQKELARVQETNRHIQELASDISSLEKILTAPKLRGSLGEYFLKDLLAQVFPRQNYDLQYTYKSGETVDAVIRLKGGMISVDAKFPLENFRRIVNEENEIERKRYQKAFRSDVKKHIDAISSKYILPDEGTLDFALMYIPAENVYYETIIKDTEESELMRYAYEKQVIPVSPNTLYVYIHTILLGLKGMQVEEHARVIMGDLQKLSKVHDQFRTDFDILGKHVNNAKNMYDSADKRLGKFENQLERTTSEAIPLEEGKE